MRPGDGIDSTIDLFHRAREGDDHALDALCERYRLRLGRWAHGRLPRSARGLLDTDDIVQDVLARTIRKVRDFQPTAGGDSLGFHAYLRQSLLNRLRDVARMQSRRPVFADAPEGTEARHPGPGPLDDAADSEARDRFDRGLATLNATDREAVIMRMELGMEYDEIADALGKPSRNAARMTVMRALERLVNNLDASP